MRNILKLFTILAVLFFCMTLPVYSSNSQIIGRWYHPKIIRIYIEPNNPRTRLMAQAFDEWTRKTQYHIVFKRVYVQKAADIDVQFVNKIDINKSMSVSSIGLTRTTIANDKKLVHATIWIAEKTQNGRQLCDDEIYTTMLHEIGHSIGLNHTNDENSVMFYGVNVVQEISHEDLKTLKTLYHW